MVAIAHQNQNPSINLSKQNYVELT